MFESQRSEQVLCVKEREKLSLQLPRSSFLLWGRRKKKVEEEKKTQAGLFPAETRHRE
jgi:hypothetical protein